MFGEPEAKDMFADIRKEWDQAEQDIKLGEQICTKIITPAIKELRYAGRRLVDALNEHSEKGWNDKVRAFLEDARFNCLRARHDAVDAAIGMMAADVETMLKKLGHEAVLKVCPDFAKFWTELKLVQEKIANSREDRDNRSAIYETIENTDLKSLSTQFSTIQTCEPLMKGIATRQKIINRASWFFGIAGLVVGALSLVGTFSASADNLRLPISEEIAR